MKFDRYTMPSPVWVGAINAIVQVIEPKKHGCEIECDPRTWVVSVFKGEKCSLILPSGHVADLSDDQGEDDAGSTGSAAGEVPRRGRPPKKPASVQT